MKLTQIAPAVARLPVSIANVYFIGEPGAPWVLVDTGTPGKVSDICRAAEARFGNGARPTGIVLTHGHFDHAGCAHELAHLWRAPVYAHRLEAPYLTGRSAYPPKDPTVGGAMAFLSRFFPTKSIDVRSHLRELPPSGEIPDMPDWRWVHTPGHTAGHVSLWNERERVLLAGDALTTVDLDSPIQLLLQTPAINRPPAPMTSDWNAARRSVQDLAKLEPFTIGCGHGAPMSGPSLANELSHFAANFPIPEHGRYVSVPAQADEHGVRYVPPRKPDPLPRMAAGAAILAAAAITISLRRR